MLKRYFIVLILSLLLSSCIGYHKLLKDDNGEPILTEKVNYTFTNIPTEVDLTKIDTSAYYFQVFEGRYYNEDEKKNPEVLIFNNDGFFKKTSMLYYLKHNNRSKNSVYYGGRFKISENTIELENFYPSRGGKTNYYSRKITTGIIDGNRIIFEKGHTLLTIFEKRNKLD